MENKINIIDEMIDKIKQLISNKEIVNYHNCVYKQFHKEVINFFCNNKLNNTVEWGQINRCLVYKSTQYLSLDEANYIIINLEKIKQIILNNDVEKNEFDSIMHKEVIMVSKEKFFSEYYADSVESAYKQLNKKCKEIYFKITGEEKDGQDLMNNMFSIKNPKFIFENINTESGRNIQQGYHLIFAGVISGIRNIKAHDNLTISKQDAYKKLVLASFLFEKIDTGKVNVL